MTKTKKKKTIEYSPDGKIVCNSGKDFQRCLFKNELNFVFSPKMKSLGIHLEKTLLQSQIEASWEAIMNALKHNNTLETVKISK